MDTFLSAFSEKFVARYYAPVLKHPEFALEKCKQKVREVVNLDTSRTMIEIARVSVEETKIYGD